MFLKEEFVDKVSASTFAIFLVASLLSLVRCMRGVDRDFPDHFSNCVCFGGEVKFVHIVLLTFLLY